MPSRYIPNITPQEIQAELARQQKVLEARQKHPELKRTSPEDIAAVLDDLHEIKCDKLAELVRAQLRAQGYKLIW